MPARLAFFVWLKDKYGNSLPSTPFYMYPTKAAADADTTWVGTGKADLVDSAGVPLSQPVSTDSEGQAWVYSESKSKLICKVVGSARPSPVPCAEDPDWNDAEVFPDEAVEATDVFHAFDPDNGHIKQVTLTELVAAVVAAGSFVVSDNDLGATAITLTSSTAAASGGADGDVWFKVPA